MEIDCSCSTDSRDEGAWSQGGDCEHGSMIAICYGVGDRRKLLYAL
jgi:hypothetical protein